jgi:predicted DNA-binding ribbon-helix-helix protein
MTKATPVQRPRPGRASHGDADHARRETVEIDHAIVVSLRPEARRRDVPVARLVRDLLDAVGAEPNLASAILDADPPAEV